MRITFMQKNVTISAKKLCNADPSFPNSAQSVKFSLFVPKFNSLILNFSITCTKSRLKNFKIYWSLKSLMIYHSKITTLWLLLQKIYHCPIPKSRLSKGLNFLSKAARKSFGGPIFTNKKLFGYLVANLFFRFLEKVWGAKKVIFNSPSMRVSMGLTVSRQDGPKL